MEDEVLNYESISGNEVNFDVSGNEYYVSVILPASSSEAPVLETLREIQSDLSSSDSLSTDTFVSYSLCCTLLICGCLIIFRRK